MGGQNLHQASVVKQDIFSQSFKSTTEVTIFSKYSYVFGEKLWHFGLFSGDKGDYSDVWIIKITNKTNEIDMDVVLLSEEHNIQKPCLSLKSGFSPLVYWFVNLNLTL